MEQLNTTEFFKTLRMLFFFFLSGQILFGGIVWWLLLNQASENRLSSTNYSFLAGIILLWMIIASFVLYRQRLKRGEHLRSLALKLSHYRTSNIFRWAMLELGNLAVICIAYLEFNSSTMFIFAIGIAVFFLTIPSAETFQKEYNEAL